MATKTDRILSYLPPTFRRVSDLSRSPLHAIASAVGRQLAQGEQSLVGVMQAHWVDDADRGAAAIAELRWLGALYGLAPRPDESVEEFREHLKRYVRTFLESTVTVQGILRVTAEVLGLHILDTYTELDTWWTRSTPTGLTLPAFQDEVVTQHLRREAATTLLLRAEGGWQPQVVSGQPDLAAQVQSVSDRPYPLDLQAAFMLYLQIQDTDPIDVNLAAAGINLAAVSLAEVIATINQQTQAAWGVDIAAEVAGRLVLRSPLVGAGSMLTLLDGDHDGAELLLGLPPRTYWGSDTQAAQFVSRHDLSRGVDLSDRDALQLRIDGGVPVVVHCDGADPARTRPAEIVNAINTAFEPWAIASHNGRFITLTAVAAGPASEIAIETPPADDATQLILGLSPRHFYGANARAAAIVGRHDFHPQSDDPSQSGVNVMARRLLSIAVDHGLPVEVDVRAELAAAGLDPTHATVADVVTAINRAFPHQLIADDDGHHLILRSPTLGPNSHLELLPLVQTQRRRFVTRATIIDEAAQAVLGFVDREAWGRAAQPAQLGQPTAALPPPDLSRGVDLQAAPYLRFAVDQAEQIEVYCAGQRPHATTLAEVVAAINHKAQAVWGCQVATAVQGRYLGLATPTVGRESRLVVDPHQTDLDALATLLGVAPGLVSGEAAPAGDGEPRAATVVGTPDLSSPVDLRAAQILRLAIDDEPLEDVNCATHVADLTAATLPEIVNSINHALGERETATGEPHAIATHDGRHLILTSPTLGPTSAITLGGHSGGDGRSRLLGTVPRVTEGQPAIAAQLEGVVDGLTAADLSGRSQLRLEVDDQTPVDIDIAGATPDTTFLDEVVAAVNQVYPNMASITPTNHLLLMSPTAGAASRIAVRPLRYLDLIEYVPTTLTTTVVEPDPAAPPPAIPPVAPPAGLNSANERPWYRWWIDNMGAIATYADITITAIRGTVGPTLMNLTQGCQLRLLHPYPTGAQLHLWRDDQGQLRAEVTSSRYGAQPINPKHIIVGPKGMQAQVPFTGQRQLCNGTETPRSLQLNHPLALNLVILQQKPTAGTVGVTVVEHHPTSAIAVPTTAAIAARLVGRVRWHEDGYWQLVDGQETPIALLRGGLALGLPYRDRVVAVQGRYAPGEIVVQAIACLFDVTIGLVGAATSPDAPPATYAGVTIGETAATNAALSQPLPPARPIYALSQWLNQGIPASQTATAKDAAPSALVRTELFNKAESLKLPLGRSEWLYKECFGSRFNDANFDHAYYPGRRYRDVGVFNVSRFALPTPTPAPPTADPDSVPDELIAVFASVGGMGDRPTVKIDVAWPHYQPGTCQVDLPGDLPARFGGRFNEARFSQSLAASSPPAPDAGHLHYPDVTQVKPEEYLGVVISPPGDPDNILKRLRPSTLVKARRVAAVPLGYTAVEMPFRQPQLLVKGKRDRVAALYLSAAGLSGFLKIEANTPGPWGNDIAITARTAGPAVYDLAVFYAGGRFESARRMVLGEPLPTLAQALVQPSPIGLLQAKAAGIHISVSRDNAAPIPPLN